MGRPDGPGSVRIVASIIKRYEIAIGTKLITSYLSLRSFMETDPKGQLGGLETSDTVRRRLASESHSLRCTACGKTNLEIMQDSEERSKASSSAKVEVEIPADLKMGWKDEMATAAAGASKSGVGKSSIGERVKPDVGGDMSGDADETPQLAEGFVQTAPAVEQQPQELALSSPPASIPAGPAQGLPAPTRTTSIARPVAVAAPVVQQMHRLHDDGVPLWVDRMIVLLVVLLAAMLMKLLLS
jgi:ubiquitin-conjugating enzyme E2 J1